MTNQIEGFNTTTKPVSLHLCNDQAAYNTLAADAKETGKIILYEYNKILNVRGVEFYALTAEEIESFKQAVEDAAELKDRQDVYINSIEVTGEGTNSKTLTLRYNTGRNPISVQLEDLDTIAVAYNDAELRGWVTTLKDTTVPDLAKKVKANEDVIANLPNTYAPKTSTNDRLTALETIISESLLWNDYSVPTEI